MSFAHLVLLATAAASPTPAAQGPIRAARTAEAPKLDGLPDDPVWQLAPPYTQFLEQYPDEGRVPPPEFRTEVRVLHDDRTLFILVVCHDPQPGLIQRQLGRRDTVLVGDAVEIGIDSTHERRSGYYFGVNAAGVLRDGLFFGDVNLADTWDGVWDAAVAVLPDGWSAEFAIPLDILRFPRAPTQEWGFLVRRTVHRTHEVFDSNLIPRSANGLVSRFGILTGLDDLVPHRAFQITPYATARLQLRPQYSDPVYPTPRLVEPSADVGADLRVGLTSDLTLNAAINPDFGQVEQDQVVLNLSNQELYFPEKRPFFTQGLELFQPVGAEFFQQANGSIQAPMQQFYSRRVGLDTPILVAAKVTGTGWKGLDIGILDSVVMGAPDPGKKDVAYLDDPDPDDAWVHQVEGTPDRRLQFHLQQPFHLGLNSALPREPPVSRNYFAAVARQTFLGHSSVGLTVTSVNPLQARCTEADIRRTEEMRDALPEAIRENSADPIRWDKTAPYLNDCAGFGGNTAGLDFNLRSGDGEWVALGTVLGSHRVGGPAEDVLRDGTVMHPGDLGAGGYFVAGKVGGEGFRFNVQGRYASPKLDLTAIGFQQSQNQQAIQGSFGYYRSRGIGAFHELQAKIYAGTWWTTDGHWTPRGNYAGFGVSSILPGYQQLGWDVFLEIPRYDVREIDAYGVPFERIGDVGTAIYGSTDPNRPVVLSGVVFAARSFKQGPGAALTAWGTDLTLFVRPVAWSETQLIGHYEHNPQGYRYVDCLGTGEGVCAERGVNDSYRNQFLFARQDPQFVSLTLRQTFVFAPRLTLQIYAQLFSAGSHYTEFATASARSGERIDLDQLAVLPAGKPSDVDNPDFHEAAFNLNVVLRWEYRLGSTLYLVYTRNQSVLGLAPGQEPTSGLVPLRLGPGPAVDTFQVKWSYFFDL
ncbi:MAG TPA: DUF5916 domain-containing protein [Myxococcaceae bacterium]|nr:DUF5916 domain-containing protein [Myxococcaceae bacterium]